MRSLVLICKHNRHAHACNHEAGLHSEWSNIPRLTNSDYQQHRSFLIEEWFDRGGRAFLDLQTQHQRDLHDYYVPSVPLTDNEVLQHRKQMTKAFPSLPQKAGRAYEAMCAAIDGTPNRIVDTFRNETTTVELIAGKRRLLRITGVARPKADHYRLARALLNLERHDVDGKLLAKAKKIRDRRSS